MINISKEKNIKRIKNNSQIVLLNIDKKKWIKVTEVAENIINMIDNMEYNEALTKIMKEFKVTDVQAKQFIDYIIDMGIMKSDRKIEHIKLIDEPSEKEELISHCYLHITKSCNLKCGYCSYNANIKEEIELSTNKLKSIIRRLSLNKISQLVFAGGEPLCRKDFEEIVEYARKFFPDIGLVTNATLINENNAEFIAKNINKIQVSLDSGLESDHDSIRGNGSYEKTINGIKLLKKYGNSQIKITPTVNKLNIENIVSIVKVAKDLDIMLEARFFLPVGRGSCNKYDFSVEQKDMVNTFCDIWKECELQNYSKYSIKHFYDTYITAKNSCGVCKDKICLDVNGDIYPCAYLMDKKVKIGNIFDNINVYEIIKKSEYGNKFSNFNVDDVEKCKNCSIRYFCGGGCMAVRFSSTENIYGDGMECTHYKNLIENLVWKSENNSKGSLLRSMGIEVNI